MRDWTPGNKLRVLEGRGMRGWASPVKGIKKGTYRMQYWVLYANDESGNTISIANDRLYGDEHSNKK